MTKWMINLHFFHAIATFLLMISGLILYSQFLRGELSSLRIYLRGIHILVGIIFIVSVGAYSRILAGKWSELEGGHSRRFINLAAVVLATGVSLTGILLYTRTDIQSVTGVSVLSLHKLLVVIGFPAALYHTVMGLLFSKSGEDDGGTAAGDRGFISGRRMFINWMAAVGALLSGAVFAKWLWGGQDTTVTPEAKSRYRNCNRMEPQPLPSLGSVPPAGGGYKGSFEVFTVTQIPCATSDNWQFRIFGLVDNPRTLTWSEFLDMPRKVQVSNFYCITGWTVYNATFEGIPLAQLLAGAGVQPEARFVKLYSGDGIYTSALSLEQARMKDVMVAVLLDGEPIPSDLGGPARLIVPEMYAYKGVKWLNAIELIHEPHIGYWESRGYANDAWVNRGGKS